MLTNALTTPAKDLFTPAELDNLLSPFYQGRTPGDGYANLAVLGPPTGRTQGSNDRQKPVIPASIWSNIPGRATK